MIDLPKKPVIPEQVQPYYDDTAAQAHERMRRTTLADIAAYVAANPVLRTHDLRSRGVGYVNLQPKEDHDETTALVVPLPFANEWALNMAMRVKLLQESLPHPMRVVVFPNNGATNEAYATTRTDLNELREQGSFERLARRQLLTLGKIGIERVHYMGYSAGASVGAAALRVGLRDGHMDIGSSGLFEAPNVVKRSRLEVARAFMQTERFNEVVNESAIPALSEEQRTRGGTDGLRQAWRFVGFGRSVLQRPNLTTVRAFGEPRFIDDIEIADQKLSERGSDAVITVGGGAKSRIMPPLEFYEDGSTEPPMHIQVVRILGYGHELAENIVVHALLARKALAATL